MTPKGSYGGHAGRGFGDVNGDGRTDILAGTAWIEQPAAGAESGLWEVAASSRRRKISVTAVKIEENPGVVVIPRSSLSSPNSRDATASRA